MAAGLSTKQREQARNGAGARPARSDLERNISLFLLGLTLCLFAFLAYGARNDTGRIIRASKPVHVPYHDYLLSGADGNTR